MRILKVALTYVVMFLVILVLIPLFKHHVHAEQGLVSALVLAIPVTYLWHRFGPKRK